LTEPRTLKRRHPVYYLKVVDRNTDRLVGRVADITTEGIRLVSEKPIASDSILPLRMVLPEKGTKTRGIDIDARSVWSGRDVNPDLYSAGFQLVNVSPQAEAAIEYLIHSASFQN
jgi:hypothetical protein